MKDYTQAYTINGVEYSSMSRHLTEINRFSLIFDLNALCKKAHRIGDNTTSKIMDLGYLRINNYTGMLYVIFEDGIQTSIDNIDWLEKVG